jgi:hypothetical protein
MKIIRVFPRKTAATPKDRLSRILCPPLMGDEADEVHISVSFTYDLPITERLEKLWSAVAPVKVGGPALNDRGGDFIPGRYVKLGYVMTSRGCPNSCWFCDAWKREGRTVRELPITEGYNLLDSNILACSDDHVKAVFKMLTEGKKKFHKPVEFTGGLEAARLKQWHVDELRKLRPKQLFFAYDTPDDLEPLQHAGKMLLAAGWTTSSHTLRAYVLCGFKGDTINEAYKRMAQTAQSGFLPMAMLYRDKKGEIDSEWQKWGRQYSRPAIAVSMLKEFNHLP